MTSCRALHRRWVLMGSGGGWISMGHKLPLSWLPLCGVIPSPSLRSSCHGNPPSCLFLSWAAIIILLQPHGKSGKPTHEGWATGCVTGPLQDHSRQLEAGNGAAPGLPWEDPVHTTPSLCHTKLSVACPGCWWHWQLPRSHLLADSPPPHWCPPPNPDFSVLLGAGPVGCLGGFLRLLGFHSSQVFLIACFVDPHFYPCSCHFSWPAFSVTQNSITILLRNCSVVFFFFFPS